MDKEVVSIKGSQDGLIIYVEESAGLSEILLSLQRRLENAKGYFDGVDVKLGFSGKKLSILEKHELLEIIRQYSNMNIISIADDKEISKPKQTTGNDNVKLKSKVVELNFLLEQAQKKEVAFHKKTLRSGQSLDVSTSLVIIGDVNNGAVVNAGGSVIILGKLRGVVNCGLMGKQNAFVFAIEMMPTLLRINNVYGRFDDNQEADIEPMIAYVDVEQIAIEPMSHNISKELEL